ncbi:Radical SAM domain protein [Caldithrix abyssi DSM 13497]|uniref:7-carboxy-7-deazaguanine synthase n=1 Tax=Caldithrix abyssi DSM 13497 TaxID=880073 RepID=H1XNF0_CALAY|nr:radical SAM protein [Caldithrix abyssi]APF18081.1 queE 7-carboxy-7-deazaguanine synthase [Caldithrix abyssi DSM 13497]EHO42121.1 Radical SAM domain protein [Caldithrix abyssi DSM 13497]
MAGKDVLKINEIFYSIQGESTYAGLPCVFVRLTYCNLRCTYCDTEYAFYEGQEMGLDEIIARIKTYQCNLVEITGGEPLIQPAVYPLMERLLDNGFEVLLETGGHMDVSKVDQRVKRIMDVKCPSSGEAEKTHWPNMELLKNDDQVKFVIGDRKDFDYALEVLEKYNLLNRCPVLFSPVFGRLENGQLAEWILATQKPIRMQLQLHKYIWKPDQRGV